MQVGENKKQPLTGSSTVKSKKIAAKDNPFGLQNSAIKGLAETMNLPTKEAFQLFAIGKVKIGCIVCT